MVIQFNFRGTRILKWRVQLAKVIPTIFLLRSRFLIHFSLKSWLSDIEVCNSVKQRIVFTSMMLSFIRKIIIVIRPNSTTFSDWRRTCHFDFNRFSWKQNSLFPLVPVIKCLLFHAVFLPSERNGHSYTGMFHDFLK